jgi:hypothetical protein
MYTTVTGSSNLSDSTGEFGALEDETADPLMEVFVV